MVKGEPIGAKGSEQWKTSVLLHRPRVAIDSAAPAGRGECLVHNQPAVPLQLMLQLVLQLEQAQAVGPERVPHLRGPGSAKPPPRPPGKIQPGRTERHLLLGQQSSSVERRQCLRGWWRWRRPAQ